MEYRKPNDDEIKLLNILIAKPNKKFDSQWKSKIYIKSLGDGNMGSFEIFLDGKFIKNRSFGKQISEYIFKDIDGIDTIASLNIDERGELYELDIWKVDYSPLKKINI